MSWMRKLFSQLLKILYRDTRVLNENINYPRTVIFIQYFMYIFLGNIFRNKLIIISNLRFSLTFNFKYSCKEMFINIKHY